MKAKERERAEREALFGELGPELVGELAGAGGTGAGPAGQALGCARAVALPVAGLKDGGSREAFPTGAVRESSAEKGRYDLLPMEALRRLAVHYERGAKKYADENWRKGIPTRRCMESALRHLCMYMHGYRDEDHLAAVLWNVAATIETQEMVARGLLPKELDNLPDWTGGRGP